MQLWGWGDGKVKFSDVHNINPINTQWPRGHRCTWVHTKDQWVAERLKGDSHSKFKVKQNWLAPSRAIECSLVDRVRVFAGCESWT